MEIPQRRNPRLVVGVGASAGGLKALESFFAAIHVNSGCCYIVVQHLSPGFKSLMDELLGRRTQIPIRLAEASLEPEADTIYLVPSHMQVTLRDRCLQLHPRPTGPGVEMPINLLFHSLGREYGPAAVGVVLSGTGSDGTEGLRAIHANGGLVIVQTPASAEFDGMPRSALSLGIADYTLPPEAMAQVIGAYAENPSSRLPEPPPETTTPVLQSEYAAIFAHIQQSCGIDFAPYKIATIDRRVRRRMDLLECADLGAYTQILFNQPQETDLLYHDLLIGVTEFFRDPAAFEALRENVLRPLVANASREEIRIWSAACASGEEPYTLAILMEELTEEYQYRGRWSIFATDVHRATLAKAGQGLYDADQLSRIPTERRDRYFTQEESGKWRVLPRLRQRIVFAHHNLLADPPFTKLDLITCRNLLIYFGPQAQERALGIFHYALRTDGCLLLGISEGLGKLENDFEVIDGNQKLFRKTSATRFPLQLGASVPSPRVPRVPSYTQSSSSQISRPLLQAYDVLLARHAPDGFIVSESGELLHSFGAAGQYLLPQSGRPDHSLLNRCDGDLRVTIATLLTSVFGAAQPIVARGIRTAINDSLLDLTAHVVFRGPAGGSLAFIAVETQKSRLASPQISNDPTEMALAETLRERIGMLEQEIVSSQENLQNTIEELQATNEELQASNEEMVAANEELQATNEELHSVNEELRSVNEELELRNTQLRSLNDDLDHLFINLDVGVLFLDQNLCIRKFNSAVQRIFRLLPQDVGRPIDHIAYQLGSQEDIMAEVGTVLRTGRGIQNEARMSDDFWLLKRVIPFNTAEGVIQGVVITFTDISESKRLQGRVVLAMDAARLVWWDWDIRTDRLATHTYGQCILGYETACLAQSSQGWLELTYPEDRSAVYESLQDALSTGKAWYCEHRFRASNGDWVWVAQRGRVTEHDKDGRPTRMVGTTENINARREFEKTLKRDAEVLASLHEAVVCTDAQGVIDYWSEQAATIFRLPDKDALGCRLSAIFPEEIRAHIDDEIPKIAPRRPHTFEWEKNGAWYETQLSASSQDSVADGRLIVLTRDISDRHRESMRLRDTEHQLIQSQKMETLGTLAGGIAHDFNNLLTAINCSADLAAAELGDGHAGRSHLASIRLAGQRATELVRQILLFSRTGSQAREVVDAAGFLHQLLPLLRSSLPSTIEIKLTISTGPIFTRADRSQLQQVLLNLCTNAAHAMKAKGGALSLGLDRIQNQQTIPHLVGQLRPGSHLRFTVSDEGTGIPPANLQRIFEPFFTTKPQGEGTGLGLSIVHGVVTAHQGSLQLHNRPGDGATFEVFLPEAEAPAKAIPHPQRLIPRGLNQTIAVIDDEKLISEMQRVLLRKQNYSPVVFNSALEFIEYLDTPGLPKPALIITDQTMPRMTGQEMIRILRKRGIDTPVILTSGHTQQISPEALAALGNIVLEPKPFNIAHLLEAIHDLLTFSANVPTLAK